MSDRIQLNLIVPNIIILLLINFIKNNYLITYTSSRRQSMPWNENTEITKLRNMRYHKKIGYVSNIKEYVA